LKDLKRFVATVETSRHRFFTFLDASILPDNMLVNIAVDDPWVLGVLSSRVHIAWALRTGGRLGVGNDPRYNKTRCFETFPYPGTPDSSGTWGRATSVARLPQTEVRRPQEPTEVGAPGERSGTGEAATNALRTAHFALSDTAHFALIGNLAEQIDVHRKRQQQLHNDLTLTNVYNVLERLRRIAHLPDEPPLTAKERIIHDQGLVSVLAQFHDELDAAVLGAYGWDDLAPALVGRPGGTTPLPDKPAEQAAAEEELLSRLVALNAERVAEEARGLVRWLRPEFQNPRGAAAEQLDTEADTGAAAAPAAAAKRPWPQTLPEQFQAVREVLAAQPASASPHQIARSFQRAPTKKVAELLETLATLGQVQQLEPGQYAA
jgi:hypothetical protein